MADFQNPHVPSGAGSATAPPMQRLKPAGFWRRLGAYFIDGIIIGFICFPVNLFAQLIIPLASQAGADSGGVMAGALILSGLLQMVTYFGAQFLYAGYFLSKKGATPGKLVLNLKVINNSTGANLSFVQGGLRSALGYLVSSLVIFIGFLMIAFRADKRGLHDLIFDSHVWHKES